MRITTLHGKKGTLGILSGTKIVVMGLSPGGLALPIGYACFQHGAEIVFGVQSARHLKVFKGKGFTEEENIFLQNPMVSIQPCDVSVPGQTESFFEGIGTFNGLVHSLAYANPETLLGESIFKVKEGTSDLETMFTISVASFMFALKYGKENMPPGSSALALTFESDRAWPGYCWMSPSKAALEAAARVAAAELGPAGIRVNTLSSGPQATASAKAIPGFRDIGDVWQKRAPLGWDPFVKGRLQVAKVAACLLSSLFEGVTGVNLPVDGGFHAVAAARSEAV